MRNRKGIVLCTRYMTWQVENLGVSPLPSSQASSLVQCTTCTTLHGSPDLQNEETEAHRIQFHSFANLFSGPFTHSTTEHLIQAKLCGNKMNKTWPPPSGPSGKQLEQNAFVYVMASDHPTTQRGRE